MPGTVTVKSSVTVIGVAGGSGSGKTTFSRLLQEALGDQLCGIISQDAYYRDMHAFFDRDGGLVNFDHPDSIEFDFLINQLKTLKAGEDISIPQYDFATHSRLAKQSHFAKRAVVIVDGILILTQAELRQMFDYSFFIDTNENVRFERRLRRDVKERGRTPEGVREQFFNQVKPMHDLFVDPSRRFADRTISGEASFEPIIEEIVFGIKNPSSNVHLPFT